MEETTRRRSKSNVSNLFDGFFSYFTPKQLFCGMDAFNQYCGFCLGFAKCIDMKATLFYDA